jgi:hypothetical protein
VGERGAVWKEMAGRDILFRFVKNNGRCDNGKQVLVSDTGSRHENISIFSAQKEHRGKLNWLSLTIA